MIAKVATEIGLNKLFDYLVPESQEKDIQVGSRVKVPFGNRNLLGYVVELTEDSEKNKLKVISKIIGEQPLITPPVMRLALWMSTYYCCPIELVLKNLTPRSVQKEQNGWKEQNIVRINDTLSEDERTALTRKLRKRPTLVYEHLRQHGEMRLTELIKSAATTSPTIQKLADLGLITIKTAKISRDPYANIQILPSVPLPLNDEQQTALDAITKAMDGRGTQSDRCPLPFLLFGVTGSGKTEIYLQTIEHALAQGQGALVLVPEIALTPQMVQRFKSRFASGPRATEIAVLHSHLSDGERHDEWQKVRDNTARIVIGTRSAIFAPIQSLGVIIVDEEHEYSYKQEDAPRYNARDVAVMRGRLEKTIVLLGSATPATESYYNATQGKYVLLKLTKRIQQIPMPHVYVVDMRTQINIDKGIPYFSTPLKEAIRTRLEQSQQTILFLNRRGYATLLQCPKCGYTAYCPNCSAALTYHKKEKTLRCHICGCGCVAPKECPQCGDLGIRYTGYGTERIENTLHELFPTARVRRMDADTLRLKNDYQSVLDDFGAGKIDILLGTQMITKGLHFPRVTLVGIINADGSLHRPDFRAGERTFQLITQVAGRAGRGGLKGEVIIQCFTPWAPAIIFAKQHDYQSFFEEEIKDRKSLFYPPFSRLALITIRGEQLELTQLTAEQLRKTIDSAIQNISPCQVNGPVPALLEKTEGSYRFHILIRVQKMSLLSRHLFECLQNFKAPQDVYISVDIDPIDMS